VTGEGLATANASRRTALAVTLAAVAAGWLAVALLVWLFGDSPRDVIGLFVRGTWGMPYGVGQVLYKASLLLLTGLSVDVALRAGLFNVGAEGQLAVAGLAVATASSRAPADTPAWLALPAALSIAALAGAAWAALPALLRARYGGHEVVSTILMNRIADVGVTFALARGLALPGTIRTPAIVAGARLPTLDALGVGALHGTAANAGLLLAAAAVGGLAAWLARARVGREIALVGLSPRACAAERIPVARRIAVALLLSGAFAGLASAPAVLGYKGYFESGLGAGAGFGGITVALLGRGHPVGMALAAVLVGTLDHGGLTINGRVPMEVMAIVQAVVILAVATVDARLRAAPSSKAPPPSGAAR
jgi:simple sugar transport system permease protein